MVRIMTMAVVMAMLGTAAVSAQQTREATPAAAMAAVNLNSATLAQLEALPGVGRATAERIIEYRTKNGGFKKIEDLMNVRGIGEKSFLRIKPLITVAAARAEK